jgi:hypothetical protein
VGGTSNQSHFKTSILKSPKLNRNRELNKHTDNHLTASHPAAIDYKKKLPRTIKKLNFI